MVVNKKTNHAIACFNSRSFTIHSPLEQSKFVRVIVPDLESSSVNSPAMLGGKFYIHVKHNFILEVDSVRLLEGKFGSEHVTANLFEENQAGLKVM